MLDEIAIENRECPNAARPMEINILDQSGHIKQIWDRDVKDEVKMARKTFERMIAKGYAAFRVKKNGEQGEKIKEFDPDAEKMILAPNLRGG